MNPRWDVLAAGQREALAALAGPLAARGYYLAGGTAIALHLGHRRSLDLDWFGAREMGDPLELAQELRGMGIDFSVGSAAQGVLYGAIGSTRVSMLDYGHALLEPPEDAAGAPVASLRDLGAIKLATLLTRRAKRDFIDIYAMGMRSRMLPEMLADYVRKYGPRGTAQVLHALVRFEDAEKERMPDMIWEIDWPLVRESIRAWAKGTRRR